MAPLAVSPEALSIRLASPKSAILGVTETTDATERTEDDSMQESPAGGRPGPPSPCFSVVGISAGGADLAAARFSRMLDGLRSQWTTPWQWAAWTARASTLSRWAARRGGWGVPQNRSARLPPSTHSRARKGRPR